MEMATTFAMGIKTYEFPEIDTTRWSRFGAWTYCLNNWQIMMDESTSIAQALNFPFPM